MFDATVSHDMVIAEGMRLSMVDIGPFSELNVFQIDGNQESDRQTPMFGRGRLDHMALQAKSIESFDVIRGRLDRCRRDRWIRDRLRTGPQLVLHRP